MPSMPILTPVLMGQGGDEKFKPIFRLTLFGCFITVRRGLVTLLLEKLIPWTLTYLGRYLPYHI